MITHRWNIRGKLLKTLYLQAIERMILYGCPIWYTGTERQKIKLNQIQRVALLCITKAFSTAPTSALQVLAGLMPLDLKAHMEASLYRVQHYKENINIGEIIIWAKEIEEKLPAASEHPARKFHLKWDKDPPEGQGIEAFTDGSKKEDKVGAAFVIFNNTQEIHNKRIRLNNDATVFQAEVLALKEACIWLSHNISAEHRINIYTDSQSSLQSVNKTQNSNRSIRALKELFHTLQDSHTVGFHWVKAHEGTMGNERADTEAKRATEQIEVDTEVPLSELAMKTKLTRNDSTMAGEMGTRTDG
ncbi:uncharacterized protein LOC118193433 [Stegodyphus dumicola]|uniref:uncharacterized protein LOC118193433 n=1 Tax=Stegodyphus dumicola TaxID=202533 RepID=UPI0015A7F094|nr:uncharacterized protein LOC118193433 [Stegodyphus dumicola]